MLGSIRTSYSAARARENLMDSQINGASSQLSQMARYNDLKKEAQANSELYNSLYSRVKEAGISAASKSSNLRVVDEAHVLDAPTGPNRMLAVFVGILAALLGGVVVAFVREQFDTSIFTPEDVRNWIGTPMSRCCRSSFSEWKATYVGQPNPKRRLLPGTAQAIVSFRLAFPSCGPPAFSRS